MNAIADISMKNPAHLGGFVKSEIVEPLGLSVKAAAVLAIRAAQRARPSLARDGAAN